jgi:hypothetical protein
METNPIAFAQATTVVCGTISIQTKDLGPQGCNLHSYAIGVLQGLKIAQELGVP